MTSCASKDTYDQSVSTDSYYGGYEYETNYSGYNTMGFDAAPQETYYASEYMDDMAYMAEPEAPSQSPEIKKSEVKSDLSARKLIKTANMSVETMDFDAFMDRIEKSVTGLGGYLSSSSVSGTSYSYSGYNSRYADITVRIPAETYDAFISGVGEYGNVTYKSESMDDVTMAYVDTESRIKAYETEYETLIEILSKAETVSDIIVIQNRITEVTYQLESYRSQLRKYDDLISYCTVYVNVSEVVELTEIKETPKTIGERISAGISDTCSSIASSAVDFVVWFVSYLPVLLIYAVVIAVGVFIICTAVKKSKIRRALKQSKPAGGNADDIGVDGEDKK